MIEGNCEETTYWDDNINALRLSDRRILAAAAGQPFHHERAAAPIHGLGIHFKTVKINYFLGPTAQEVI